MSLSQQDALSWRRSVEGAPCRRVYAVRGLLQTMSRYPTPSVPNGWRRRIPQQSAPEGVASQLEQTVVACPSPTATALRPVHNGLRCGVRPRRQRDQRRYHQLHSLAFLMELIAHMAGLPQPSARCPVAEQRRTRRPLLIDCDQRPAQMTGPADRNRRLRVCSLLISDRALRFQADVAMVRARGSMRSHR